ncbi:MAG: mechanosensitive ion channel [Candidatus Dependentiae bacterium]|nr:mechanosensitive ion channel [Candidatus Dependentiae bacterium]
MNIFAVSKNIINQMPTFALPLFYKFSFCFITFVATRMVISGVTPFIQDLCKKNELDYHSCHVLNKLVRYILIVFGTTVALQNIGVEVSMLIATFGITGIVLSYGMKDIVANFIAGILVMGYKHIKINDYIKIDGHEGKVVDINLRYATLQSDDMMVFVPNIVLYTQSVAVLNRK